MPIDFPIRDLPVDISLEDAVEAVYGDDLNWVAGKLRRGTSVLVECDKQLVTYLYAALRSRLRDTTGGARAMRCRYVSGQPGRPEAPQPGQAPPPQQNAMASLIQLMVREIAEMVRSAEPGTVIVVP